MSDKITLKTDPRKILGRKVKKLRREGQIPANLSGKGVKSLAVQMSAKDFQTIFAKAGETTLLDLKIGKEEKTRPVLIHQVQVHPVTDEILHVDFRQVDLTEKVTVAIPVEISGVASSVNLGGVLIQLLNEIEVEALPRDLPEKFIIDVSKLETIGQGVTLKEIKVDSAKVKIMSENPDELVVKIEEPTKEKVVETPAEAAPAEGEAVTTEEAKTEVKTEEKPKAEPGK